jgi:two-component system chemotaxis response regulator CheY
MGERIGPSILIVEDRLVMLKIIRRLLVQLGYSDIDDALNGLGALEKVRSKRYDLILSDWNMDGMTGFELLKVLRADPETATVPFVLITAEAKQENMLAAKAAGVNGYLLKPFKLDMLQSTIEAALAAA